MNPEILLSTGCFVQSFKMDGAIGIHWIIDLDGNKISANIQINKNLCFLLFEITVFDTILDQLAEYHRQ